MKAKDFHLGAGSIKRDGEADFYFVPAHDPEQAVPRIVELVSKRIPDRFGFDPIKDIQVLCPMNRGGVGARSLNIELQAALNPAGDKKVERFGWTFAPGKVVQIENDYDKEVYNGDIGMIADIDLDEGDVAVDFDGRTVTFAFGELDTLVPAYAATIHKRPSWPEAAYLGFFENNVRTFSRRNSADTLRWFRRASCTHARRRRARC